MLVAGELVDANIARKPKVARAERVGRIASARSFPVFDVAHRMNDLGAGAGLPAAVEDTTGFAGEGIESGLIGQGRLWTGILLLRVLGASQPARLREAEIDVISHRADMRLHSL